MMMASVTMGNGGALTGRGWEVRTSIPYIMGDDTSPTDVSGIAAAHYPSPASSHGPREVTSMHHQRELVEASSTKATGAGRCPSRYDWSKHMAAIKHLYIDEDRPLKEVMEIMQKEHNFVAT